MEEKHVKAIVKLIRLTQEGKIKWHRALDDMTKLMRLPLTIKYYAHYKDNYFVISMADPLSVRSLKQIFLGEVILEITDLNYESIWQFPSSSLIRDLWEIIMRKKNIVPGIIDDFLSDNL